MSDTTWVYKRTEDELFANIPPIVWVRFEALAEQIDRDEAKQQHEDQCSAFCTNPECKIWQQQHDLARPSTETVLAWLYVNGLLAGSEPRTPFELKPSFGHPETRSEADEDGEPYPGTSAVGWDMSFGCSVSFLQEDGLLCFLLSISDWTQKRGVEKRTVTPEQVRSYARQLLVLADDTESRGRGEQSGEDTSENGRVGDQPGTAESKPGSGPTTPATHPAPDQRTWSRGDAEPADGPKVRDVHGDVWVRSVTGVWLSPETQPCSWEYIARKFAPLTEVFAESTSDGV